MEPILLYFGKMMLCSALMFAYYLIFLKDKTFHHYNRFYLMAIVLISLALPMIKVSYFTIETNQNIYLLLSGLNQNIPNPTNNDITIYSFFYAIAGLVSVILLIRLIVGIIKINAMRKQFPRETINGIHFYQTNLQNAPFSFFRNLFWKKSIEINSPIGQQILKHEMVHIEQKHTWDKLLMQFAKTVFWFNPVFYFINKEINLIHEYLADKKAVKKSDTKAFAQMLIQSHFSGAVLPATSPFLSSNLKKRLTMITKNKTKYGYARKLFALPILFFIVFAYLVNAKNREIQATNKAIDLAINELKNDTIKPKSNVKEIADSLKNHKSEDVAEAASIDKLNDTKDLDNRIAEAEKKAQEIEAKINTPEFRKKIDAAERLANEKINTPEFSKKIAEAEKRANDAVLKINSAELRKKIEDAQKIANDVIEKNGKFLSQQQLQNMLKEKLGKDFFKLDSNIIPDLKDLSGSFDYNFGDDFFYNTEKTTLTPKELKRLQKKRQDIREKQKDLQDKQKKLQEKQQELNKEMRESRAWAFSTTNASAPTVMIIDNKNMKLAYNDSDKIIYFINNKIAKKDEIETLDPKIISFVNVYKNNGVGTIKITTR